ncbi:hypothetical protein HAX54_015099, partial [Datura stramonium]|nr:hypothetical protein [Datura stramonium]
RVSEIVYNPNSSVAHRRQTVGLLFNHPIPQVVVDRNEEYRHLTTFFISPNSSSGHRPQWIVSPSDLSTYLPLSEKD